MTALQPPPPAEPTHDPATAAGDKPVLRVRDLRVRFATVTGPVEAVRGVSFDLLPGRTLGLVGESGSGKSVSSYSILRLLPSQASYEGSVLLTDDDGTELDVLALPAKDPRLFAVRGGRAGMVFQEPMTALSPVHRVGEQVAEALRIHRGMSRSDAAAATLDMLDRVGIPDPAGRAKQYPFEFSGGMRQRVVIAMALVCRPRVLIADEPTTALDVTVQAQILRLIDELKEEVGASVLFITHDLGVIAQVADDVAVMRGGRVVEIAPVEDLYRRPLHPYTRKLLRSVPGVPTFETAPDGWADATPDGRHPFLNESGAEPELLDLGNHRKLLVAAAGEPAPAASAGAGGEAEATASLQLKPSQPSEDLLLEVRGLTKRYAVKATGRRTLSGVRDAVREHGVSAALKAPPVWFKAVDNVDLDVRRGETLGVVGESGSGKTTLVRCILRAVDPTAGTCLLYDAQVKSATDGKTGSVDLAQVPQRGLKPLRKRMQMVFQDPMASLNPRMTVGDIVCEPLLIHGIGTAAERKAQAAAMLGRVGLPKSAMSRYPHAFSGGQRQRVGIARALVLRPALVVLDEATSALDVSIRGQVLELLRELQLELGLTYLFVAHDLSLVRSFCDRVAVMRRGRIVERGPVDEVLENPTERYTRELLSAVPVPDPRVPLEPLAPEAPLG